MQEFIVLFKGVNVGGNNILPMKALVSLLKKHDFYNVSSYIQSGNIVVSYDGNPTEIIKSLVNQHYGFTPELFILNKSELTSAFNYCPYNEHEGKFVHYYFCQDDIKLNTEAIDKHLADSEIYTVKNNVLFLYAPNGIGRSKLVANITVCLGQSNTGRNLNTIRKVMLMVSTIK